MKTSGAAYARFLARLRDRYRARRAAGLCVYCPQTCPAAPALPGKTRCQRCLLYGNRATAKRVRRLRRAGLCPRCGRHRPEAGFFACADCRDRSAEVAPRTS